MLQLKVEKHYQAIQMVQTMDFTATVTATYASGLGKDTSTTHKILPFR